MIEPIIACREALRNATAWRVEWKLGMREFEGKFGVECSAISTYGTGKEPGQSC